MSSGPSMPSAKGPDVIGDKHRVSRGETWSSLALKKYGDAMLGGPLAEHNGAEPGSRLKQGIIIKLPNPDVLNRRMNEFKPDADVFGGVKARHILPTGGGLYDEENSVVRDAKARIVRARAGMGLHAKGGGWKPIDSNIPKDAAGKPQKPKFVQNKAPPKLEDKWLRRMARLPPRTAMKLARHSAVGTGPTLALLGGLREADGGNERMELVERFLQAYGGDGHMTVNKLLKIVAR